MVVVALVDLEGAGSVSSRRTDARQTSPPSSTVQEEALLKRSEAILVSTETGANRCAPSLKEVTVTIVNIANLAINICTSNQRLDSKNQLV